MNTKYYIGLDGHSKNCFFVVLNSKGKVIRHEKVPTCESEILNFIESITGSKSLIMDETTITQWLYVLLHNKVNNIIVTQSTKHSKAKTDFKEAHEHALNLLSNVKIKHIYHSLDDFIELRSLVSGYKDLVQSTISDKNRYKALFRQSAIIKSGEAFYRDFELINSLRTNHQRFVAISLYERIAQLEKQKKLYEKQFESNVDRFKEIRLLTSVPGIGPIRANQIVAIVVSPYRFPTKYHFFAYSMLVGHKQMSDGKIYGCKRPKGQSDLKNIFKSSRLPVLKGSSALRIKYDLMISNGSSQNAAYGALARTIASLVLGVWKSGKKYNDKLFKQKVENIYALKRNLKALG
jgi:hypothetical protein